jgi:hypothetical protein
MFSLLVFWFLIVAFLANNLVLFFVAGLPVARIIKNISFYNVLSAVAAVAISRYVAGWTLPLLADLFRLAHPVSGIVPYRFDFMFLYFLSALLFYLFSSYFLPRESSTSLLESSQLEWWLLALHLLATAAGCFQFWMFF